MYAGYIKIYEKNLQMGVANAAGIPGSNCQQSVYAIAVAVVHVVVALVYCCICSAVDGSPWGCRYAIRTATVSEKERQGGRERAGVRWEAAARVLKIHEKIQKIKPKLAWNFAQKYKQSGSGKEMAGEMGDSENWNKFQAIVCLNFYILLTAKGKLQMGIWYVNISICIWSTLKEIYMYI